MASYFEEECFFLGERSNHMVTITPFVGKVNVNILQFYVNGNGEMKPGKSRIMLELNEFELFRKLKVVLRGMNKKTLGFPQFHWNWTFLYLIWISLNLYTMLPLWNLLKKWRENCGLHTITC